jgi:lipopolysaccharide export system protein LptC
MSDAATRERAIRQHWAEPDSRHDHFVRLAKLGLPVAVLLVIAILAIAPFDRRGDVSFILDKNKVDEAQERMRVEQARYSGEDNEGRKFAISAERAIQQRSDEPVVTIQGIRASLDLASGPLSIAALRGRYDLDAQKVSVSGPVRVSGPDGYRLATSDVLIDLKQRTLVSDGPVEGAMRLGRFEAGHLVADLGSREVALTGGARLKIVQGAVR